MVDNKIVPQCAHLYSGCCNISQHDICCSPDNGCYVLDCCAALLLLHTVQETAQARCVEGEAGGGIVRHIMCPH